MSDIKLPPLPEPLHKYPEKRNGVLMVLNGYTSDEMRNYARAAVQANVPDGWKLVPVEPTEEMLSNVDEDVGGHCYTCTRWRASYDDCRRVYAAMLSSAPPVPQPAERKPLEDDEQKRNDDLWRLGRSVGK